MWSWENQGGGHRGVGGVNPQMTLSCPFIISPSCIEVRTQVV